jgi:hypothetical protein
MKKIFLIISALFLMLFIISCKKVDVPRGTPYCIKKKIRELEKDGHCIKVYECLYHEERVYYFFMDCTNLDPEKGEAYNDKCNTICGNVFCFCPEIPRCPDIWQKSTDKKLIYSK